MLPFVGREKSKLLLFLHSGFSFHFSLQLKGGPIPFFAAVERWANFTTSAAIWQKYIAMRGLVLLVSILWTADGTRQFSTARRSYNPDRDSELTLGRTQQEVWHLEYDVGATIDPFTNQTRYDGFKLVRALPKNRDQIRAIKFMVTGETLLKNSLRS